MKTALLTDRAAVFVGDSAEIPRILQPNTIDSLVCDPPAGIEFMGKEWDSDKGGEAHWIAWLAGILRGAFEVLKPGAHGLVWAIPRTSDWTMRACREAGFEVRDVISHLFGTGFPKSKAVDKAIHESTTQDGSAWEGWGTALKPAAEFWILVRKPLNGTIAANVLAHGTGGLNVDGCRIEAPGGKPYRVNTDGAEGLFGMGSRLCKGMTDEGRWPANVVLSHSALCMTLRSALEGLANEEGTGGDPESANDLLDLAGRCHDAECPVRMLDEQSGPTGASRFFYVAKAPRKEKDHGCESLPRRSGAEMTDREEGSAGLSNPRAGAGRTGGGHNHHPTVKSIALMRWLVRLVTPPGGTVLDPFAGSGSTGVAAVWEGFDFVGVELSEEYAEIAKLRVERALADVDAASNKEGKAA